MKLSAWAGVALVVSCAAASAAHVAVCVGVNRYKPSYISAKNWLYGCVADAGNLWTNLVERGEWAPADATLLLDAAATKAAIRAAITNAAAAAAPGDVFVYTHSSHGYSWSDEDGAYTADTGVCAYDGDYEDFELAADLAKFPSGTKVVVFVDACHSAGLFKARNGARALSAAALPSPAPFALAERVGAAIDAIRAAEPVRRGVKPKGISSAEIGWVTAADYDQYSFDSENEVGGEFTTAALEGWRTGLCDDAPCGDEDCYASFYELWNYAKDIAIGHGPPGTEDYTEAQCFNADVLRSVRAGWVGDRETLPGDPPRFRALGDGEFDAGETAEARVRVYAPAEAPVTNLFLAAGDPAATLADGWFSFTPTRVDDYDFTLVAENANGVASNGFTLVVYPAEPEPPTVTDVTPDSFNVVWTPSLGAEGYEVFVYRRDRSRWQAILRYQDVGDATNYVVTGLAPDTEYRAKIAAYAEIYGGKRYSWDSDYVYATTDRTHAAPSWSAVAAPAAQAGRPYRLDLAPFLSGYPAPALALAAGDAVLGGTTLAFAPAAEGTNAFTVVASNDLGTATATFEVAVEALAPKKFAVCVGINEYENIIGLEGCVNDAEFMAANLEGRGGWAPEDVAVLLDSAAAKAAIRGAISNVAAQAMAGDTFVYQHSSHGGQFNDTVGELLYGDDGKATYLCVYDEDCYDNATAYNDYEIAADLAAFPAGVKVAVIVDACHSGGLFKGRDAAFDLAGRVSAHMEAERARRRARGENVARSLAASEIGWAVAAEYYEYSLDGGFYHTDAWMTDPYYGDEWLVGGGDYPDTYRRGGIFLCSSTWGWWSGDADTDAEAGDNDGLCDVYEFWKKGYDFSSRIGDLWGDPDYTFHPQCTNATVLRSVELGWSGPSAEPFPAIASGATPEALAVRLAGSADTALVEHVRDAATYDAFRAWAGNAKDAAGASPAGLAAVRASPWAWLAFAIGSDRLLDLDEGDLSISSFAQDPATGALALEVGIDGAAVADGADPDRLAETFLLQGTDSLDDEDAMFTPLGLSVESVAPANGRVRFVAAPPAGASSYFLRVLVK